jgi:NAD(P)-dependent dehydrogenase (short-subunit alcohol dehydrogenase family)
VTCDKQSKKIILVTGAGSGIGQAVAVAFAELGYFVLVTGRNKNALDETVALVEQAGGNSEAVVADLGATAEIKRLAVWVSERFGRLDVLVNNAAIALFGSLQDIDATVMQQHFYLNTIAPIYLTQQVIPLLRHAGGGHVINISSEQALKPAAFNGLYGSTKAALNFLTRSMAAEFVSENIRINTVAPGAVDTQMLREVTKGQEVTTPLGRLLQPHEIAKWVVHLVQSDMVTGSVLLVDGGVSL